MDKISGKKKLGRILYVLLMLGLIVTGIVQLMSLQNDEVSKDRVSILVMAPEGMSVYEYNNALEILKERFKLLAGEEKYSFQEDKGCITVTMPVEVFGEADVEEVLKCYVIRPTRLYLYAENSNMGIRLSRADITCFEELRGRIPDVNPEDFGLAAGADYVYYKICFSEEVRNKVKKAYGTEGGGLHLVQDREEYPLEAYSYLLIPTQDGTGYYFINNSQQENLGALVKYNYENEPFSQSFSYRVCYPVEWEKVEEINVKGQNQCDVEQLEGNLVTLQYSSSKYGEVMAGEFQDTIQGLKMRLDALGTPYAFGYTKKGEHEISIKLSSEKIGEDIVVLLGKTGYPVEIGNPFFYLHPYFSTVECVKDEDGYYSLEYQLTSDMSEAVADMEAIGCTDVYLQYDSSEDIILSKESTEEVFANMAEGKIAFHNLTGWGLEQIDEGHKYLLDFIATCYNGISLPEAYYMKNVWFDGKQEFGIQSVYLQEQIQEMEGYLKEICPTATVHYNLYGINIDLNLGMSEDLPQRAVDMVQEIYQKCGFADGEFDVTINLINEKNRKLTFVFGSNRLEHTMEYHGYYIGQEVADCAVEFACLVEEKQPLGSEAVARYSDTWMQDWSDILWVSGY